MHCHSTFTFPLLSSSLLLLSIPCIFLLLDIYKASLSGKSILEIPRCIFSFSFFMEFFNVINMVFCIFTESHLFGHGLKDFFYLHKLGLVEFILTMVKKQDILMQILFDTECIFLHIFITCNKSICPE